MLSRHFRKTKGEKNFLLGRMVSFYLSAAMGNMSLMLSQPPTPMQQGRAVQESLAMLPWNPLLGV